MKMLLAAVVLAIACPVLAQAADPPAGHNIGGMKMRPDAMTAQGEKMKVDGDKNGGNGIQDGKAEATSLRAMT